MISSNIHGSETFRRARILPSCGSYKKKTVAVFGIPMSTGIVNKDSKSKKQKGAGRVPEEDR